MQTWGAEETSFKNIKDCVCVSVCVCVCACVRVGNVILHDII